MRAGNDVYSLSRHVVIIICVNMQPKQNLQVADWHLVKILSRPRQHQSDCAITDLMTSLIDRESQANRELAFRIDPRHARFRFIPMSYPSNGYNRLTVAIANKVFEYLSK